MPDIAIVLSAKTIAKLEIEVARNNDANGTDLSLDAWVQLHLQEIAIAQELHVAATALQEQQKQDANAAFEQAVNAKRVELLAAL